MRDEHYHALQRLVDLLEDEREQVRPSRDHAEWEHVLDHEATILEKLEDACDTLRRIVDEEKKERSPHRKVRRSPLFDPIDELIESLRSR